MKRIYTIAGTVFLAFIYCFAIFHFSNATPFIAVNDTPDTVSSIEKQIDFVSASQSSIDYSINQLTKETSESKNNSSNPLFFTGVFHPEKLIFSTSNHYTNQSKNRAIRYRKNDFIFPFHYHW